MTMLYCSLWLTAGSGSASPGMSPVEPQITTIFNDEDQLYTQFYAHEEKETVILLHGGPGFPTDLQNVVDYLWPNYQVISFHQRGTRQSPCPSHNYSMAAYLSDINRIAAHFKIDKFHLWGHSWGGLYAQIYAQTYPERLHSLFLCSPGSGTGEEWKQTEQEVMQLNRAKSTSWAWIKMGVNSQLGKLGSDRAYQCLFKQVLSNYHQGFSAEKATSTDLSLLRAEPINKTRPQIVKFPALITPQKVDFPVTIIYGDQDIYGGSKNYVLNRYPQATVHSISHSGHIPWVHNPAEYKTVLADHFKP